MADSFSPWWLNILPLLEGSPERKAMLCMYNGKPEANMIVPMRRHVYDQLGEDSEDVWRLTRHLVT